MTTKSINENSRPTKPAKNGLLIKQFCFHRFQRFNQGTTYLVNRNRKEVSAPF